MKGMSKILLALFLSMMTLSSHASLLNSATKNTSVVLDLVSTPGDHNPEPSGRAIDSSNHIAGAFQRPVNAEVLKTPFSGDIHTDDGQQPLLGGGEEIRAASQATSVPEPSVVLLLLTGLLALVLSRRRTRG